MAGDTLTRTEILGIIVRFATVTAFTYLGVKWMVNAMDPTRKQKLEAKKRAERIMKRIGVEKNIKLTEYELAIASHLVEPIAMTTSWESIAGLEDVIRELQETVILPIKKRDMFKGSQLIQPPKGVLLHGPPGCGKTLLARATAREAGTRFINLEISSLTDKWYGESQKLAASVFTLALKLQPCIIFIDEIDSFLRARDSHDHEATAMMKAQFMSLWDGLMTDGDCCVVVMGATNRPQDVDKAILRRMPATFFIGLPNVTQRREVLRLIMASEPTDEDVDFHRLAKLTEGFSGSDIRELCRNAAMYRVREYMRDDRETEDDGEEFHSTFRSTTMADFLAAITKMKESKYHCGALPYKRLDLD